MAPIDPYLYPVAVLLLSMGVAAAEALWPWRPKQRQWRSRLWSDALHLVFNAHFLGVLLFLVATTFVIPPLERLLTSAGLSEVLFLKVAASWPVWVQIIVVLVVVDFLQWCVHNLLHRVPFLWDFHKVHHSVVDGEMDWIVSFRFQWTEVVVYKSCLYLPLAFFGFGAEAVLFHAIFGTAIGHLNHANLKLTWGPLRYVLNSPVMHIWHHDYEGDTKTTVNFGIIFSCWDWIFGTAKMPESPPARIGFKGVETFPTTFFAHAGWPLAGRASGALTTSFGVALLTAGAVFIWGPGGNDTPMLGEVAASSQPRSRRVFSYAESPEEATKALAHFGTEAKAAGFAQPEQSVSVDELARALQAPRLRVVDVRPEDRFNAGHIPSAQRIGREDYSVGKPIPGMTQSKDDLTALLAALDVTDEDSLVLYGDGGPEPYRLWWSLKTVLGRPSRVLDGGLTRWKAQGHGIATGARPPLVRNTPPASNAPQGTWAEVGAWAKTATVLDTRTKDEFEGVFVHRKAARGGRLPGARHFEWTRVFRSAKDPRMKDVSGLKRAFTKIGLSPGQRTLTMCQSGTRSASVLFALLQAGWSDENVKNYDGSWAEYSRLQTPVATGKEVQQ